MPRRLTIAGLMGIVVVVAAGMAALRNPNRLWDNVWFSFAVVSAVVAGIAATATSGHTRAGCRGFAAAAGIYLLLTSCAGLEASLGHRLATTAGFDFLYEQMHDAPYKRTWYFSVNDVRFLNNNRPREFWLVETTLEPSGILGATPTPNQTGAEHWTLSPHALLFFRIAHSLSALLAGALGGLLCLILVRRSNDCDRTPSTPAVSP